MTFTVERRSSAMGTVATLCLATLTYALLQSLVSPALPILERTFGTSETGITWVLTAYLLSAAVSTPVVGRLGDLYGKRRMLLACLAAMAIGTVVAALAADVQTMVIGRVIQGVGGGVFVLAYGIIRDEFPSERVAGATGVVTALFGLGLASGVVLSGVILEALSYVWLFWIPCAASVVALAAAVLVIPESPKREIGQINWSAALLMSVGMTAVLVAVSQTSVWGWGSFQTVAVAVVGIAFLIGWVALERRSSNPLVDVRLIAARGIWVVNLLAIAFGASIFVAIALIPRFAQAPASGGYGFGASLIGAVLLLVPLVLAMVLVSSISGRVEAAWGSRVSAMIGTALSLLAFAVLLGANEQVWTVSLASALLGAGAGFTLSAMSDLIVEAAPVGQTEAASEVIVLSRSIGLAFGGQIGATLLANSTIAGAPSIAGYHNAFLIIIVVLVLTLSALAFSPAPRRQGRAG